MQYHYENNENDKMMEIYPRLIEKIIEFRVFYRKVLAERKGDPYQINPEHEQCSVADNYRVLKIRDYEYKCEMIEPAEDDKIEQLDAESDNKNKEILLEDTKDDKFPTNSKPSNEQSNEDNPFSRIDNPPKPVKDKVIENDSSMINLSLKDQNSPETALNKTPDVKVGLGIPVSDEKRFEHSNNENSNFQLSPGDQQLGSSNRKNLKSPGSHSVLQIETEAADTKTAGGFCGCSK